MPREFSRRRRSTFRDFSGLVGIKHEEVSAACRYCIVFVQNQRRPTQLEIAPPLTGCHNVQCQRRQSRPACGAFSGWCCAVVARENYVGTVLPRRDRGMVQNSLDFRRTAEELATATAKRQNERSQKWVTRNAV